MTRASATPAEGAVLATLSLSDVTLSPAFSGETLNYTASVVSRHRRDYRYLYCARRGTAWHHAVCRRRYQCQTTTGHQVDLAPGADTPITIAVTAGDATTFYKIVITRGAAAADATLSATGPLTH